MDSWMPWTIACNFIRAFCPTLILVINWDLWRNLGHAGPAKQWAIMTDVVAFGIVLTIRLSPPLVGMGEQLKSLFDAPWVGWIVIGLVMAVLAFPGLLYRGSSPLHKLLLVAGYAFCADLARVCKLDYEMTERRVKTLLKVFGLIVAGDEVLVGTFWKDAAFMTVFLLVLVIIGAFKWWGEWGEGNGPVSYIQELGLDRKE